MCLSLVEIDIAWEFNDNQNPYRSGWANASSDLTDVSAQELFGELRCNIIGYNPRLDSPNLYLTVSNRHYIVMRGRYDGQATQGRLLLRSGAQPSSNGPKTANWIVERQPMVVVSSTDPVNTASTSANCVDGDMHTLYTANVTNNAQITFDLGSFRLITGMRILGSGDKNSPKRCVLFRSTTVGLGPYEKVALVTLQKNVSTTGGYAIEDQSFTGFTGYGRYWKLLLLDNYGGSGLSVREVNLDGYDERVTIVPISIDNSGDYSMYYLPINTYLSGILLKMRLELMYDSNNAVVRNKQFSESFAIDYLRIMRAPEIHKVRGCLDKYFDSPNYRNAQYNVSSPLEMINGHLARISLIKHNMSLPYASTYNCPLQGGTLISIEGINFGSSPLVTIGEVSCPVQSVSYSLFEGRRAQILCILPPGSSGIQRVRVQNGMHSKLFYDLPALSYRNAPPVPARPLVTNLGAYRVDLIWNPPGDAFDIMTITGYKIIYFPAQFPSFVSNMTVSNVTTTSVRGLHPGT
jgi:hypothetical protein